MVFLRYGFGTIKRNSRMVELCERYRYDIYAFAVEALGVEPTWQQELLFESIAFDGSRTSVAWGMVALVKGL